MNQTELIRTWHAIAVEGVPAGLNLWPRISARLPAARGRPRLQLRLAAGLALALALVAGATAQATLPAVRRLLLLDPALHTADPAALGQPLHLSQTVNDVTVSVEWLHVEAERVLVGYTLTSADGRRFDPVSVKLTAAGGAGLEALGGYGVVGQSGVLGVELPPGESSHVSVFARPPGEAVGLTLTLMAEAFVLAEGDLAPGAVAAVTPGARMGPFVFELPVP